MVGIDLQNTRQPSYFFTRRKGRHRAMWSNSDKLRSSGYPQSRRKVKFPPIGSPDARREDELRKWFRPDPYCQCPRCPNCSRILFHHPGIWFYAIIQAKFSRRDEATTRLPSLRIAWQKVLSTGALCLRGGYRCGAFSDALAVDISRKRRCFKRERR